MLFAALSRRLPADTITAIGPGMTIALFSYLGVKAAAAAAAKLRNPAGP